jgi:hypothetical protein
MNPHNRRETMKKHFTVLVAVLLAAMAVATWAETKKGAMFPKDWMTYKFIGALIITDQKSPLFGIHHFYMNKKGLETFKKGGAYPDGTIIVDAVYEAVMSQGGMINEGKKLFYPVMIKDSKGKEAKETGGWIFAAFDPDGKPIQMDVKKGCFECHASVKDSDYVFSKPLK